MRVLVWGLGDGINVRTGLEQFRVVEGREEPGRGETAMMVDGNHELRGVASTYIIGDD